MWLTFQPSRHRVQGPPCVLRVLSSMWTGQRGAGRRECSFLLDAGEGEAGWPSRVMGSQGLCCVDTQAAAWGSTGQQCGCRRQLMCVQACVQGFSSGLSTVEDVDHP